MTNLLLLLFLFPFIGTSFFLGKTPLEPERFRCIAFKTNKLGGENVKKIVVDIDNTICVTRDNDYVNSLPIYKRIDKINHLYKLGNEIHYWTARGSNGDRNWDFFTYRQLKDWGVLYTSINMGKPHYDMWIDDKSSDLFEEKHNCSHDTCGGECNDDSCTCDDCGGFSNKFN